MHGFGAKLFLLFYVVGLIVCACARALVRACAYMYVQERNGAVISKYAHLDSSWQKRLDTWLDTTIALP